MFLIVYCWSTFTVRNGIKRAFDRPVNTDGLRGIGVLGKVQIVVRPSTHGVVNFNAFLKDTLIYSNISKASQVTHSVYVTLGCDSILTIGNDDEDEDDDDDDDYDILCIS